MRVMLLPSTVGANPQRQYLTSLLVNDSVALDAGCVGFYGTPQDQARVRHVFLSHSHIDHLASLPIFLNNVFLLPPGPPVTVYGSAPVLECLRNDLFNDRLWPDFLRIFGVEIPRMKVQELKAGEPVVVDGLTLTPIPVDHVVPTFGFLIEDDHSAVIYSADTGPTEAMWKKANQTANLKAIFLEVTFQDSLDWLGVVSKHLTPHRFGEEARKLKDTNVACLAIHIHPTSQDQVVRELEALGLPNVKITRVGMPYEF